MRQSVLRAAETPIQAQVRSERQAALQAARRAIETPEQLQARRIHNAEIQTTRCRNFMRKNCTVNDRWSGHDSDDDEAGGQDTDSLVGRYDNLITRHRDN
ncbi:hypothetical protein J6590_066489 [Homalodisca vitripennis]|nr:hypothetical protein J6590_066489 [Homalodisca vitripennis]